MNYISKKKIKLRESDQFLTWFCDLIINVIISLFQWFVIGAHLKQAKWALKILPFCILDKEWLVLGFGKKIAKNYACAEVHMICE